MGSTINPIYASLYSPVPGGASPAGSLAPPRSSGSNPAVPITNLSPSGPVSTNAYGAVPGAAPSFPANSGGYPSSLNLGSTTGTTPTNASMAASSPFSFLNAMTPKDQSRMFDSLKKTYGDGMAHMIMDFLTSGAGFNQQAINNLLASMQPGIERGTESLMEQFSTLGNRFGSGAQIGLGDYLSQVNLNEGQLVTQMYEDSLNKFMDVMMGAGSAAAQNKASSPSWFDSLLGIGQNVAQGIGSLPGMPSWASIALGA